MMNSFIMSLKDGAVVGDGVSLDKKLLDDLNYTLRYQDRKDWGIFLVIREGEG